MRPLRLIRLDANAKDGYLPPPGRYTAALLCDAIDLAAKAVRFDAPTGRGPRVRLGFGRELDKRPLWRDSLVASGQPLDPGVLGDVVRRRETRASRYQGSYDRRIPGLLA